MVRKKSVTILIARELLKFGRDRRWAMKEQIFVESTNCNLFTKRIIMVVDYYGNLLEGMPINVH